jgi:hypothetical protein
MCLLNGEVSGSIHANSSRFDVITEYDTVTGEKTETKLPIKDIIKEMVHGHAGEPLHNIIVNDLDEYGIQVLEYRGSKPLYILFDKNNLTESNISLNGPEEDSGFRFRSLITSNGLFTEDSSNWDIWEGRYYVSKLDFGNTAGYKLTDLIYNEELIVNAGETVTSVLDKIKTLLGDFEYFYDINGRFIF